MYQDTATTVNPEHVRPQTRHTTPEGHALELPELWEEVKALDDVIDVDYIIGACPPTREMNVKLLQVVLDFVSGKAGLPPKGVILASERTLCEECPRQKPEKVFIDEIKSMITPSSIRKSVSLNREFSASAPRRGEVATRSA